MKSLAEDGYYTVVGLHPKSSMSSNSFNRFTATLQCEDVVGLGEVGLDHSVGKPDDWYGQEVMLRHTLEHLTPQRVLVLHVRGMKNDPTALYVFMRCLDILIHSGVPSEQRIQLHCYVGNTKVVHEWLAHFPNTYFSVSGAAMNFNRDQEEAMRIIPRDRLLLETDAPYFPLVKYHPVSAPHMLHLVASSVAAILRDVSTKEVLSMTATNAKEFFRRH